MALRHAVTPGEAKEMQNLDPATVQHLQTLAGARHESVAFVFLNTAGATLGLQHVSSCEMASVEVPLRSVVGVALAMGAREIVMAHNHPSGDPEPTAEDFRTTRRVADVLSSLGIRLVDHLVLAGDAMVSFRARGLL
ncbi:JAB domain-containing protein [Sphingomonas sp.]|jgi:DNA repair protein RadC|uniref:JAB domain-containing protein n=1 Tax=Sphingomonas sp. TaxID=28214 RepID=UPI002631218B|nr:JAB domain-containing protein [Sphingomonas sp.]MDF2493524.1 repair protein [Sphingomonas sp.]